jgi:hypothetical protein
MPGLEAHAFSLLRGSRVPVQELPFSQTGSSEKRQSLLFVLIVLAVGFANVAWRLQTPADWWFEDDPYLYAAVRGVAAPWLFFYDIASNRIATSPNELAPVLLSSMWLDLWLAPRSTAWAYWHNALAYLATAVAFYFAMARLLRERWLALATTIAWMLLPSTSVLVEFLSTRHYMIGMFWALLAVMSVDDALNARPGRRTLVLLRVAAFTWLSIISKEFYPPAVLTLTFLWFAWRRDWRGALIPVLLGAAYLLYRVWMTEPALAYYGNTLLSPGEVLKLLWRLPYMVFGSWAGYLGLVLTAILLWRRAREDRTILPVVVIGGATILVSLLVIYPVGYPVSALWRSLGTWYRTPCVINTLLLVAFAYGIATVRQGPARVAIMALLLVAVFDGSQRTAKTWDRMKAAQVAEADFMFSNPDKTLVSKIQAVWFLRGLVSLYPERRASAVVSRWDRARRDAYLELLRSSRPFWVYEDGQIREGSAATRQRLLAELP